MKDKKELRQIVRIANVDLDGDKPIYHELTKVRGIGSGYSNMVCSLLGISKYKNSGELSEQEISRIEDMLKDAVKYGPPDWMLNRRKDPETGKNVHIITNDLKFIQDNDIKFMRKIKSYKGMRHASRLPVRGQKTKSNFRKSKGKVAGVKRSK
ncbi:30S ribosomal protein S13 [Candidatus Woesearchaeota archaeon]|nr:30S ribosomal protein S13 [Candidatus Woesearchaeota archaeon]